MISVLDGWIRAGDVWALWVFTPAYTWVQSAAARFRSPRAPWGLPRLSAPHALDVAIANSLVVGVARLLRLASDAGLIAGEESPASSRIWTLASRSRLARRAFTSSAQYFRHGWRQRVWTCNLAVEHAAPSLLDAEWARRDAALGNCLWNAHVAQRVALRARALQGTAVDMGDASWSWAVPGAGFDFDAPGADVE